MPEEPRSGVVSLLTDFGLRDNYVGQVKGVILGIAPAARLVDVTHEVPPQDVLEAAFQLATSWRAFPPGTVHLGVVDPGVGTERRAIALSWAGHLFVVPDNGLVSLVLGDAVPDAVVVLDRPAFHRAEVSSTFHGRDLFGPVAAHLAAGRPVQEVGSLADRTSIRRLDLPGVAREAGRVWAPVLSIDHFGNCRTLLSPADLPGPAERVRVRCGHAAVDAIVNAYGAVEPGETLALFGSHGGLEIAVRDGSAALVWEVERGDPVEVFPGT